MEITLPSVRKIGDGHPAFIICEIGSNWRNLQDCLNSIAQAKAAGADAVKFQLFDWDSLYGIGFDETNPVFWAVNEEYRIPIDWLPKLKEKADACGIEFMCTAFSPELYDAVDPYVNIHKVASAEMTHVRILEKLRKLGKPVILSTGAHGLKDIETTLKILRADHCQNEHQLPVVLMHCVANYPAQDARIERIEALRQVFSLPVGYSDHTTDFTLIPVLAANTMKACAIEKHFTIIPEVDTPDCSHSITVDQFQIMVQRIKQRYMEGQPFSLDEQYAKNLCAYSGEENDMVLKHNRRLIAIQDIKPGDVFQEGVNFGIYRSLKVDTDGLSPFAVNMVSGKVAKTEIKAGDGIGPQDI